MKKYFDIFNSFFIKKFQGVKKIDRDELAYRGEKNVIVYFNAVGSLSVKRPSLKVDEAKRKVVRRRDEGELTKNSPLKADHNSKTNLYHIIVVH